VCIKKYNQYVNKHTGIAVARQLIYHTLNEAKKTGLPVLHFFSEKQKGETFSEKLANAIEEGFFSGYQRLIVCGTDTPNLNSEQLIGVASKLDTSQMVLGPSEDGGVYLIGLQKNLFDRESFLQIPWLTASVFTSLYKWAAHNQLSFSVEQKLADVDNAQAIRQWAGLGGWFILFIRQALLGFKQLHCISFFTTFYNSFFYSASSLRGPPTQSF
jgi:hypothetical protein